MFLSDPVEQVVGEDADEDVAVGAESGFGGGDYRDFFIPTFSNGLIRNSG